MKKNVLLLILCAALALMLAGCGRADAPRPAGTPAPAGTAETPAGTEEPGSAGTQPSFPLLAAPFSDAETEDMVNHNALRCALLVENYFFCGERFADGSCALVRYEVIDNSLYNPRLLRPNCAAEGLCARDGRLYYLGEGARPESIGVGGDDRRAEWDAPCLNLQLFDGALYALTQEGSLVCLDTGETLLTGCYDAFLSSQGIFYTARADARAHLYDPGARTDVVLTAEGAEGLTVVGSRLYYATREADGKHICALDLMSGERFRQDAPFSGAYDVISERDGSWAMRVYALYGEEQLLLPLEGVFAEHGNAERLEAGRVYRCRGLDGWLRTDEILTSAGESLGFALVLPDGSRLMLLAAESAPEK